MGVVIYIYSYFISVTEFVTEFIKGSVSVLFILEMG